MRKPNLLVCGSWCRSPDWQVWQVLSLRLREDAGAIRKRKVNRRQLFQETLENMYG